MQNKQQKQHLPVQQPQLASSWQTKNKMGSNSIPSRNILSKPVYTHTNIPIHWASNQHCPENGLSHLRTMECLNVHIISSRSSLLFMQMSIYSQLTSITNKFKQQSRKHWALLDISPAASWFSIVLYIYIYIYISKSKVSDHSKGKPKIPFLLATTPICRRGWYFLPGIAPVYPWSLPYNAEVKQGSIK